MIAIFEREFKSYFHSIIGYAFSAFLLLFIGIYTMVINLKDGLANFEYVLLNVVFVFLIIIPVLTMRVIAEERKQKTDQLLYTLPLSMTKIVLGKYFAMLAVFTIPVAVASLYPIMLSFYGNVNLKMAYCAIIGFYLLGAALISIGMFISSLTENQAIAVAISFAVLMVNFLMVGLAYYVPSTPFASLIALTALTIVVASIVWILTKNEWFAGIFALVCEAIVLITYALNPSAMEGLFPTVMQNISLFEQFYVFSNGVMDMTSVVYFLAFTDVIIFLTTQSLEKRRWN